MTDFFSVFQKILNAIVLKTEYDFREVRVNVFQWKASFLIFSLWKPPISRNQHLPPRYTLLTSR